jgi:hypothetical protein
MAYEQKQPDKKDALKDYVEVNQRVIEFWEKYPNGRIHTEIISWNDGVIVMKAEVYRDVLDQIPFAVGHAYEKENSTFINKTSCLENAETSCVGRALGLGNFSAKRSIASKEEVENAIHQQEEIKKQEKTDAQPIKKNDPALKAKYNILNGSPDGFEEFIQKMQSKGYGIIQISEYMSKKIAERKEKEGQANE